MTTPIKTYSKAQLANLYCISWKLLRKWIEQEEGLNINLEKRIFKPDEVRRIFDKIGNPC